MTHPDDSHDLGRVLNALVPDLVAPPDRLAAVRRRVQRRRLRVASVGAASVALVALGVPALVAVARPGDVTPPADAHRDPAAWVSCAADAPEAPFIGANASRPPVESGFKPVAVVTCTEETQQRADGGTYRVGVESRADDIAALLAALRLPAPSSGNQGCPYAGGTSYVLVSLPWFALLDKNSHWATPSIPADACGNAREEVSTALRELSLRRVATRVISVLESPEAAAAGCGQSVADMISVETHGNTSVRPGAGQDPFGATAQIRQCAYRVPADQQGTIKPAGTFEHGGTIPPDRLALIKQALTAAGPAKTCSTPGGRFATLSSGGLHGFGVYPLVYVELDGCLRILIFPGENRPGILAQGDAALAELINQR